MANSWSLWVKILVDIFLVIGGCGAVSLLYLFVDPLSRGFFCDDPSIRYHRLSDTIKTYQLLLGGIVVPTSIIVILEVIIRIVLSRRRSSKSGFLAAGKLIGLYLYGVVILHLITQLLKFCVGRPRPHFFETCKPNVTVIDCSQGYIGNYTCTSKASVTDLRDARKSFPSELAALASYAATFLIIYTEVRLYIPCSTLFKSMLHVVLALVAFFCAYTRVRDNRQHVSDVVVGSMIGVALGLWLVFWVARHTRGETCLSKVTGGHISDPEETIHVSRCHLKPPPAEKQRSSPLLHKVHT